MTNDTTNPAGRPADAPRTHEEVLEVPHLIAVGVIEAHGDVVLVARHGVGEGRRRDGVAAREAHEHPGRTAPLLSQLLHDLFQPQEMLTLARRLGAARVVGAGSALYVPLPGPGDRLDLDHVLVLRHAGQGQRLFTHEDARLAERVVEQVCRVLAHDRAVEQGRTEERARIAQDLHDDIGARLLTLMYKAGDPEIEDYIRHTLQDLKTLTRGLAASSHPLSHAAGEWKADLAQRLGAAGLRLDWRFDACLLYTSDAADE